MWVGLNKGPALATAYSNVAVDQMLMGLVARGVKVVRLGDPEKVNDALKPYSLSHLETTHRLQAKVAEAKTTLEQLRARDRASGGSSSKEVGALFRKMQGYRDQVMDDILNNADVILSTCIGAGAKSLKERKFSLVLVDECTQASEPSCLIPVIKATAHVVLIGDHCQLPPTMTVDAMKQTGLSISLFERLLDVTNPLHPENALFKAMNKVWIQDVPQSIQVHFCDIRVITLV
jgi:regulator of nonsense transcripts 1